MMCAHRSDSSTVREGYAPVENGALFYREVGHGQPIILLHGGPDFDHTYLLPDMDRLADTYRLIYYDQRGRGKSSDVPPAEVRIQTEIEDLERLRQHLQLESAAVLGHSFGGILAMEYAIRHPEHVSHLILMNTAAASQNDFFLLRDEIRRRKSVYQDKLDALTSGAGYQQGDPDAVTAYYRIHFGTTIRQPQHLDRLMAQMRLSFTNDGVLKARAIEEQLYKETWYSSEFDLFPRLRRLRVPTLVIHGDFDFVPLECAAHIAQAVPGARFVVLSDCGHFAYIEAPDNLRKELANVMAD